MNRALLASGADIAEMNAVRKHLSAIKGGRLAAAAYPAEVVTLLISDVPGDDPSVIGSGPTVADPTSFAEARAVLDRYAIAPPAAVAQRLAGSADETPKPGDARLARSRTVIVASPMASLVAAAEVARAAGIAPLILGDAIEGEAREVGKAFAGIALSARRHGTADPAARRASLRRRDDGDGQGRWPRRTKRRVPRRAGPRPEPRRRHLRARGGHRRDRRQRGQCRCGRDAGHAGARQGGRARRAGTACRQRLLLPLRRPRRSRRHRPDAHQRQRFPGDPDRDL